MFRPNIAVSINRSSKCSLFQYFFGFICNLIALYKDEGYRLPVISIFAKPVICSALMGICTLLTYNIINNITMSNTISVLAALCVAALTYFGPYVLLMKKFKDVF